MAVFTPAYVIGPVSQINARLSFGAKLWHYTTMEKLIDKLF
jgi:hypothetical protein